MAEHCPTCGASCRIISSDEGTQHYEPVVSRREFPPLTDAGHIWRICNCPWCELLRAAVGYGTPKPVVE